MNPANLSEFSRELSESKPLSMKRPSKSASLEKQAKLKQALKELDLTNIFDNSASNQIPKLQAKKIIANLKDVMQGMDTSPVNREICSEILNKINSIENLFKRFYSGSQKNKSALLNDIKNFKNHAQELYKIYASQITEAEKLKSLPGIEEITDGLYQIQVLNQYADGTPSGFENCGFHALKNSLLMLSDYNPEELNSLFSDKKLFSNFYNTRCWPYVKDKETGRRDASLPMLRQILEDIETRSKWPETDALAKILKDAHKREKLAIFQMSTTTGTAEGTPLLSFTDILQSKDGLKLYQFARSSGPDSLTLVFGNEAFNHWFTLQIHKDANDELSFVGCDSMDNHHSITGEFSPLGKFAALIKEQVKNTTALLHRVYAPLDNNLAYRAGWIGPDDTITEQDAQVLLDNKPNPLLASSLAPTGSPKEIILANCIAAFHVIQEGGWLSSTDLHTYLKIQDLETLIHFYLLRLRQDDPFIPILGGIYQEIQNNKNENLVLQIFDDAINELDQHAKLLTPLQKEQVRSLFTHFKTLYKERKALSQIQDVDQRMYAMNKMAGYEGIEPGFTSGTKPTEAENILLHKIHLLLLIYQEAKKRDRLDDLMKVIHSGGDGCLTARYGRVEEFHASLHNFELQEASQSDQAINLAPTIALSEFLTDYFAETENPVKSLSEALKNKKFFSEHVDNLAAYFSTYSSIDSGQPFRLHLKKQGIIQDETNIDWNKAVAKILEAPEFSHWLDLGKAQAISQLNF